MTEDLSDSFGPTPLLQGRQLEACKLLATRLDLTNAFTIPKIFVGTRFTRREIHEYRMDQSQLDRFYLSNKGQWICKILKLKHVQSQILSDHNPIILIVQLSPPPPPSHGP